MLPGWFRRAREGIVGTPICPNYWSGREDGRRMNKNQIIVSMVEALAGIALILVGGHGRRVIGDQLRKQKISFAPYAADGQSGNNYNAYPELRRYAGSQVTSGPAARRYAERYIAAHEEKMSGGRTYSELSAQVLANPDDVRLGELKRTVLDAQLLQVALWNTYGWWMVATVALWAGVTAVAGVSVSAIFGVVRRR